MNKILPGALFALLVALVVPGRALAADCTLPDMGIQTEQGGFIALRVDDFAVAGDTSVLTTDCVYLRNGGYFGLWFQCSSSSGTPDVDIGWQASPTRLASDFVAVSTVVDGTRRTLIADDRTAETAAIVELGPPPMLWGRLSVDGNAGNANDTTCDFKLYIQR